jgi:hypothetical protein
MNIRIAILSDLHCHPKAEDTIDSYLYSDASLKPLGRNPVTSLLEMIKNNKITANILLSTGDLTNKCNIEGLQASWKYIKGIKKELKADIIAATLGNHDIDSRHIYGLPFIIPQSIKNGFPIGDRKLRNNYWKKGYCYLPYDEMNILIFNSVHFHNDIIEAKRGKITEEQIEDIDRLLGRAPEAIF